MKRLFFKARDYAASMRWVLAVLLMGLTLAGAVSAHEGPHDCSQREISAFNHLGLWEVDLAAGENATRTLGFDGCPLEKDWWLLFWIESDGGLQLELAAEGQHIKTWQPALGVHVERVRMPVVGYPQLSVSNPTATNASFTLYFDQTCDCTAKGVPRNGPVFLNIDAQPGDQVSFDLRVLPFWPLVGNEPDMPETIAVRLTPMVSFGSVLEPVPEAAKTLTFDPASDAGCDPDVDWEGCTSIGWEATLPGMQVLWVEVLAGAEGGWTVMVLPAIDVEKATPVPWWLAPVALVGAAVARQTLSRHDRRRD